MPQIILSSFYREKTNLQVCTFLLAVVTSEPQCTATSAAARLRFALISVRINNNNPQRREFEKLYQYLIIFPSNILIFRNGIEVGFLNRISFSRSTLLKLINIKLT